jgi:hypothetical protein
LRNTLVKRQATSATNTWAAFVAAFAACRQETQRNVAWLSRLVGEEFPHLAHSTEEFLGPRLLNLGDLETRLK